MTGELVDAAGAFAQHWLRVHDELAELFHRHQVALLDRDAKAAAAGLAAFRSALEAHIDAEEQLVLPVFAARGGAQTDSPPEFFRREHDKLRSDAGELVAATAALAARPDDRVDDRALLALLDREAAFKNLMLHHDLRERNVLYPRVAEWTTPEERAAIVRGAAGGGSARGAASPRPLLERVTDVVSQVILQQTGRCVRPTPDDPLFDGGPLDGPMLDGPMLGAPMLGALVLALQETLDVTLAPGDLDARRGPTIAKICALVERRRGRAKT